MSVKERSSQASAISIKLERGIDRQEEQTDDYDDSIVTCFADLETGVHDILARVISKSQTRHHNGYNGEVKYFFCKVMDAFGDTMDAVAFGKNYERLFPKMKSNKLYIMRQVWAREADPKFTSARLKLQLTVNSHLEEQADWVDLNFVQLSQVEPDQLVDLIGVIIEVLPLEVIITSAGKQISRRHVTIVDMSDHSMWLTMWAEEAENFTGKEKDVLVTRKARIGTYKGRSASARDTVYINPDIDQVRELKNWYSKLDANHHQFVPMTKTVQQSDENAMNS